ncbi:hypothetical protein AGDE_09231 [Angomonas deanei]|uniref:WD domain, G-beta repeat n=1 Tax=Angomonas deanei TaxID=59799 RepID=A0A7G2C821_9TRYP|nr:hypothetical protein AGDE_09231 [Angomonas deanei]CAD2214957.1 hypothetical protein, conserved [Angomonas deanei]|eukprot:EPY31084.1 hypothetical protein AGDE_09231 [Angomonas deanei]
MVTSLHELLMVKTAFVGHLLSQQSEGGEDMWEPSEEVTHVDTCPCKCEALQWIPWQQGTGVCVFLPEVKEARIYSLIQEKWVLLDTVATRDATVFSISPLYSIALAFAGGKLELLARQNPTSSGNVWQQTSLLEEDDVVETSGRARTGVKERYCMEWDSTGILLAVGSKEGRLRIFLVANSGTEFQSTVYMDDQFSQMGGITQVSWAPLLGRSFLILAVVSPSRVTLIVFRRSRHLLLGYKSSTSRSSSSRSSQLHLLTSTSITVSQALQLIWDPSTSNFTTTHADGTVCSWELNIRYTHAGSGAGAPSPSVEGPTPKKGEGTRTGRGTETGASHYGDEGKCVPPRRRKRLIGVYV